MIASLAPMVTDRAKSGDKVAIEILKDAAKGLAQLAKAVIKNLDMADEEFEVAISGSVFNAGDILLEPFTKSVESYSPKVRIIQPKFGPAMGAVLLALHSVNDTPISTN